MFKNRLITIGSINTATEIIAIIPHEFFINERLAVTVLSDSLTEEPTSGTKLLIAKRAVFIDKESTLWAIVFLYERTNIKIDITNTVTDVKAVFIDFDIPPKSSVPFMDLAQPRASEAFVSGNINETKNPSTKLIKRSMEPLEITAAVILPPIVKVAVIIGRKAPITVQRTPIYWAALLTSKVHTLKTVTVIQTQEHKENASFSPSLEIGALIALKTEIIIIKINIDAKLFNTSLIPDVRYVAVSSKKEPSSTVPPINSEKSPFKVLSGKNSQTLFGSVFLKWVSSSSKEEVIAWICANQLGRRNISEETRKYLIGLQYETEKIIIKNKQGKNQHSEEETEIDDEDISDEQMINDILGDISGDAEIPIDPDNIDLNEARRQEVIMRTKYLSQKIEKKKNELFSEWSEKFFLIFSKNFGKFKNTLIDLHLEEKQLNKLNENLDLALENMEIGLTEILQEYMNDDGSLD